MFVWHQYPHLFCGARGSIWRHRLWGSRELDATHRLILRALECRGPLGTALSFIARDAPFFVQSNPQGGAMAQESENASAGILLRRGDRCTKCGKGTIEDVEPEFESGSTSYDESGQIIKGPRIATRYVCKNCGRWRESFPPPPKEQGKESYII